MTNARALHLTMLMALAGGFALILYNHGASWWYAPLAAPAVVLVHMAVLGGLGLAAARIAPSPDARGALLHRPRLYDWLVRAITLGGEKKLRRRMLDLAGLRPGDAVLDVGCGTGTLLLAAAERVGPSGTLHGVEPAAEMLAHARRKAEARRVALEVVEGSADALPYPPASFDVVFCTLVLHHLPESRRAGAILEMRRVLRPGGRLVIADLQRPRLISAFSLVSMLHRHASVAGVLDVEPQLERLGFAGVARHSFGTGAIGAVVARLGSV